MDDSDNRRNAFDRQKRVVAERAYDHKEGGSVCMYGQTSEAQISAVSMPIE